MYRRCFDALVERQERVGALGIVVASHNENSIRYAAQRLHECKTRPGGETSDVSFAQLFGMCDHVTFTLGHHNFCVHKMLPYGDVDEVLPYLTRRAHENSGVLRSTKKERSLLYAELKRRAFGGGLASANVV